MRRSLLLLLIVSFLPLGCGENQVAKESREARAEFESVVEMVGELREGYLRSEKGMAALGTHKPALIAFDDPAVAAAMKAGSLRDYHSAVMAQAEAKLQGLLSRGQTSQRVAAHQLLASLHLASAGHLQREAMMVSDSLGGAAASIESFLSSIERVSSLIGAFSDNDKPVLEKWTQSREVVSQAVAKLKSEADTLKTEIDGLDAEIQTLSTKRDADFKQASALRAQAFQKKGVEEHDLHIKAIDVEREGQRADSKIDELTVKRDLAQAKMAIVSRELSIAENWAQTLTTGVGDVQKRQEDLKTFEDTIVRDREQTAKLLSDEFQQLAKLHEEKVASKLASALTKADTAIDTLKKAETLAKGDDKVTAKFDLLDALIAKLNLQADTIVATSRFATVGSAVKARAGKMLGEGADAFATKIDEAQATLAKTINDSKQTLAQVNAVTSDAAITSIKEGTLLGDARVKRIASAKQLAGAHMSRLSHYDGSGINPAAPPPGDSPVVPPADAPAAPAAPPADAPAAPPADAPAAPPADAPAAPPADAPAAPDAGN